MENKTRNYDKLVKALQIASGVFMIGMLITVLVLMNKFDIDVKNAANSFLKETGKAISKEFTSGVSLGLFVNYVKRGTQWFVGLFTKSKTTYESL